MNTAPGPDSGDWGPERTATPEDSGSSLFCRSCGTRLEKASPVPICPICLVRSTLPVVNAPLQDQARDPGDTAPESKAFPASSGAGHYLFAHYELEIAPDG